MEYGNLYGLTCINVELTSRCNKNCHICGRRKRDKDISITQNYGDMPWELLQKISKQCIPGVMIQFHNNGEGLLYHRLGEAFDLFKFQHKSITTNGKLLVEKQAEIIGKLDTIAISVIESDPEAESQLATIKDFLTIKGSRGPLVVLRLNGDVDDSKYKELGCLITRRALHAPEGSYNYVSVTPTIPEHGLCLDLLSHLAISKDGDASVCVRFDPEKKLVLGNIKEKSLVELWNSRKRHEMIKLHKQGRRDLCDGCSQCDFYGIATSGVYNAKS